MNVLVLWRRLHALIRKEMRQMVRDRSTLSLGLLLPVVLILLFGYGLSFDVNNARIAVVMEDRSIEARQAVSGLEGSSYLEPLWVTSMAEATQMLRTGGVDAILHIPLTFSRDHALGQGHVQVIQNGIDTNTATTLAAYLKAALAHPAALAQDRAGNKATNLRGAVVIQRIWFNDASVSTWYLVPGLIVLIMTLIGAFLTSLLIAREWERGTLESLFVTPVRPLELIIAKLVPYLLIGMIDLVLCLVAAKWLFDVPMRGSLWIVIVASLLYLMVSLCMGLFISGVTRNQFTASQVALITSFMPALMLSGFVFDLRNVPVFVQVVSTLLPATYFISLVKTLFLAGNQWPDIIKDCSILALYVVALITATHRTLRKRLD